MKNRYNRIFLVVILLLLSVLIYAEQVEASNRGIANSRPGDYIIRPSGEKVILKQADIDYARRQLGTSTAQNRPSAPSTNNSRPSASSGNSTRIAIFLLVVVGIIIIIGVSVSNITTTVAKNSGMDEESAKKLGKSAGVLAGTAAAIGAAVLLGKRSGFNSNKKDYTITGIDK